MKTMEVQNTAISEINNAYLRKRAFFDSGATRSYGFRIEQLKKLKAGILKQEDAILHALKKDLAKPEIEAYASELSIIYREIDYMLDNLKQLMSDERRATPIIAHPSSSKIVFEPKGVVLIISPWNYPFQLLIAPFIGAIAAGNAVILKPSEETPHTALLAEEILHSIFDHSYVSVLQGVGEKVVPDLIENHRLDHIFFTGSGRVGAKIGEMAARQLTPVTLELGGKSPAIVDKNADLKLAAKRICWGKFFNCGQTCLAPDYALVHEDVKAEFLSYCKQNVLDFYGQQAMQSADYGRIVNERHMRRLVSLLEDHKVVFGGDHELSQRYFSPTIVDEPDMDSNLMREEIFGPIMPLVSWQTRDQLVDIIRENPYPLSMYLFTNDTVFEQFVLDHVQSGNCCVNNTLMQFANIHLPFGGIGLSGSGRYFGEESFKTFSNAKSVMKTGKWIDPAFKYPPYNKQKFRWVKRLLNL